MSYRIEYAPNIRSRCSHCDQVILEGEIRITTGTQHWRVDCVSAQLLHAIYNSVRGRLHQLPGLMSLNKEDRKQVMLLFQALSSSASNSRSSLSTLSAEWAHALRTADVEQATNTSSSRHATLSLRSLSGSLPSPSASVSVSSSTTTSPATFTTSSYRHLHKRPLEVCSPLIDSPSLIHADSSSPTTPDIDIDIDTDIHLPSDPSSRTVSNSPFSWMHSNNSNPNAMSSDQDEGWTSQPPQKKRQRTHSVQMQIPIQSPSQSHAFQPIVSINTPSSTFGMISPTPHQQHQQQHMLQPTSHAFPPPLHPPPHPHSHPHVVSATFQSIDNDDEMRDNNENLLPSTSSSSSPSLPSFPHFPVSCFPQRPLPLSNPHFPSQSRTMFPT